MPNIVTIDFHGDQLLGIDTERGPLIPLRPLVLGMGLDWSAQFRRVKRDPILAGAIAMMATGADPEAVFLPLDLVPGFQFRIDASRVAEPVRAKVLAYQRECFAVLARTFLRPNFIPDENKLAALDPRSLDSRRRLVREARVTYGIASAQRLWFALGLPTVAEMREPPQGSLFPNPNQEH